ncbi:MAG: M17 family peptidase N-terminal domain-containing protein, partial [Xanthobacteraceae bacterium]
MPDAVKLGFVPFSTAARGTLVVCCDDALKLGGATRKALGEAAAIVKRAAAANGFKGKPGAALDILAPEGLRADRLIVIGVGKADALAEKDLLKVGGVAAGKIKAGGAAMTVVADLPAAAMSADQAASVALGIRLRLYKFDRYKTRKKKDDDSAGPGRIEIAVAVGDVAA